MGQDGGGKSRVKILREEVPFHLGPNTYPNVVPSTKNKCFVNSAYLVIEIRSGRNRRTLPMHLASRRLLIRCPLVYGAKPAPVTRLSHWHGIPTMKATDLLRGLFKLLVLVSIRD